MLSAAASVRPALLSSSSHRPSAVARSHPTRHETQEPRPDARRLTVSKTLARGPETAQSQLPQRVVLDLDTGSTASISVMNSQPDSASKGLNFATTQWSLVISAATSDRDTARSALEHLCRAYWMPLYVYIRRRVADANDAQDLTQAYFQRLLEKGDLADADPSRGRFRSFLLSSLRHFLANEWDRKNAVKRGGGQRILSLDFAAGEVLYDQALTAACDPERLFERQWAHTVLNRVMQRLEREQERAGKSQQFFALQRFLAGRVAGAPIAAVAAELEMTESAARMAVSRLRGRYAELLRNEIAETVASEETIDEEIRHLFAVFSD